MANPMGQPMMAPGQQVEMSNYSTPAGADENAYVPYEPLQETRYDVTDPCESLATCPCQGWQTRSMSLGDQEVTLIVRNWCGSSRQKRPYAQLGSVDKHSVACGCSRLVSDFAPLDEQGQGGLSVGCLGMDTAKTDAIVADLQMRKGKRGGIAQIRKMDYVIDKMVKISTQVPVILQKYGVQGQPRPAPAANHQVFMDETIDVTPTLEKLCCANVTLTLGPEEVSLDRSNCFGLSKLSTKREYGQMGYVEKKKNCICCFSIESDISPIPAQGGMIPGCPCTNRAQVTRIVRALRDRMAARGQSGQIRKQEKILGMIGDVEDDLKLLVQKQEVPFPPDQQYMKARFGDGAPDVTQPRMPIETTEVKSWDITSKFDSCLGCLFTCGIQGFTTETMELKENDMYIKTVNNLDDSDAKTPYGELDSVDVDRSCCCCFSVNDQVPGFGCDREKVEAIAADLNERKEKRGNIAQMRQLRTMQSTSVGVDVMTEMLLQKAGAQYPPAPETLGQIFPNGAPRGLVQVQAPIIKPVVQFETKTYNVANYFDVCGSFLTGPCFGCKSQTLELRDDELVMVTQDLCNMSQSRTPYANLGSVETEKACCCCSILPDVAQPGCGCSEALVQEIAAELQIRKEERGNIAQLKQQENIIIEVLNTEARMDVFAHHVGVSYPPPPEVMASVFAPAMQQ